MIVGHRGPARSMLLYPPEMPMLSLMPAICEASDTSVLHPPLWSLHTCPVFLKTVEVGKRQHQRETQMRIIYHNITHNMRSYAHPVKSAAASKTSMAAQVKTVHIRAQ